jgi:hypothetical protein
MYYKLVNFMVRVFFSFNKQTFHNPIYNLEKQALDESSLFISKHLNTASLFTSKKGDYWPFLMDYMSRNQVSGYWLEFGVRDGVSAKFFSPYARKFSIDKTYYGFDSFKGIRNQWTSINEPLGSFSMDGTPPSEPKNCKWVVGWVEETLNPFLESNSEGVAFCHFDFDVYEPTRYALQSIRNRLLTGSLVIFDEFHGYPGWKLHEKRALEDIFVENEYEFIAFSRKQAAIRIL